MDSRTYRECCDCGATFGYSLDNMSMERRFAAAARRHEFA